MEKLAANRIVVSGEGVREGIAYSLLTPGLPSTRDVRAASIASLTSRFRDWSPELAERRRGLAAAMMRALDRTAPPEVREALLDAATLLDVGRAIDFFDRIRLGF